MRTLLAALPIALLVALLLSGRVSAARAAWISLTSALAIVLGEFGLPAVPGGGTAQSLAGVAAEGIFLATTILWILLPALAIHELQTRGGALEILRVAISSAAPGGPARALLIGWFFALFLEGAAGFGTPLAIAAPMLVAMGVAPTAAVAMGLVGHAAGVTFGAVGTPVLAQAALTQISAIELSQYTALLMLPLVWLPALTVLRGAPCRCGHAQAGAWRQGLVAAALFGIPYLLVAMLLGPELPTLAGALLGGLAFIAYVRRARPGRDGNAGDVAAITTAVETSKRGWLRAATPYLAVIALILLTRLVPPVKAAASSLNWSWELYGSYEGAILPLYHPGTLLLAAFFIGAWIQRSSLGDIGHALMQAARRLLPAVMALAAMLTLSRLMLHAGLITELAATAEHSLGQLWPAIAPGVGALGSFITGSATASNILFTSLQQQAALNLGLPVVVILAAQTVGAAFGNAIAPHNIIAGAAAVGATGREGDIMRQTLPACALVLLLSGLLALALVSVA